MERQKGWWNEWKGVTHFSKCQQQHHSTGKFATLNEKVFQLLIFHLIFSPWIGWFFCNYVNIFTYIIEDIVSSPLPALHFQSWTNVVNMTQNRKVHYFTGYKRDNPIKFTHVRTNFSELTWNIDREDLCFSLLITTTLKCLQHFRWGIKNMLVKKSIIVIINMLYLILSIISTSSNQLGKWFFLEQNLNFNIKNHCYNFHEKPNNYP